MLVLWGRGVERWFEKKQAPAPALRTQRPLLSHLQARLLQRHDLAIRLVLGLVHLAVCSCWFLFERGSGFGESIRLSRAPRRPRTPPEDAAAPRHSSSSCGNARKPPSSTCRPSRATRYTTRSRVAVKAMRDDDDKEREPLKKRRGGLALSLLRRAPRTHAPSPIFSIFS